MTLDFERFRLRTFLDALHDAGQLDVRDGPLDLVDVAAALGGNPKAVLFRKVGPEGWDLAGNVAASRERLALAFGTSVAGVMAATGTRDGREIVLTLETLRSAGRLTRDSEGRYILDRG